MGAACSCCDPSKSSSPGESYSTFSSPESPPTEADLEARRRAASAAEQRMAKFDASAGGKAARKAVANVAKEREAEAAARQQNDNARDWLS